MTFFLVIYRSNTRGRVAVLVLCECREKDGHGTIRSWKRDVPNDGVPHSNVDRLRKNWVRVFLSCKFIVQYFLRTEKHIDAEYSCILQR